MKNAIVALALSLFAVTANAVINVPNGAVQYISREIQATPDTFFREDNTQDECRAMIEQAFADVMVGIHKEAGTNPELSINQVKLEVGHFIGRSMMGGTSPRDSAIYIDRAVCGNVSADVGVWPVRYVVIHEMGHQLSYMRRPDLRTEWLRFVKYNLDDYENYANRYASYLTQYVGWDRSVVIDLLAKSCARGNQELCESHDNWVNWVDM